MSKKNFALCMLATLLLVEATDALVEEMVPKTRNSPLVAVPERAKLEPFSGGTVYGYEIAVPPGTGGSTPKLRLAYSSLTKGSPFGFGWTLLLGNIERCTRLGAPQYSNPAVASSNSDIFEIDGEILARDPDPNHPERFYPRAFDGRRAVYYAGTDHWEVTQPDGTRFVYGYSAQSKIVHLDPAINKTFRWALEKVIDTSGNYFEVDYLATYDASPGFTNWVTNLYPLRIRYSMHTTATVPATQRRRLVQFVWNPRRNDALEEEDRPTNFRPGFRTDIALRLGEIRVGLDNNDSGDLTSGERIRSYTMVYAPKLSAQSPSESPFSKLVAIRRYDSTQSQYFETSFQYTSRDNTLVSTNVPGQYGFSLSVYKSTGSSAGWTETRKDVLDINGDGFVDLVSGGSNLGSTYPAVAMSVRLGSMNESGDFVFEISTQWKFCTSSVDPRSCPAGNLAPGYHALQRVRRESNGKQWIYHALIDLDGDGRVDFVETPTGATWNVRFNLGYAFGPVVAWTPPSYPVALPGIDDRRTIGSGRPTTVAFRDWDLLDLNGDGRPDHVVTEAGFMYVARNTGTGFASGVSTGSKLPAGKITAGHYDGISGASDTTEDTLDLNGDGFPDLVSSYNGCWRVGFGLGNPANLNKWNQPYDASTTSYSGGLDCAPSPPSYFGSFLTARSTSITYNILFVTIVDANQDDIPDFYTAGGFFYLGLGDGRFSQYVAHPNMPGGGVSSSVCGGEGSRQGEMDGAPGWDAVTVSPYPNATNCGAALPIQYWVFSRSANPPEGLLTQVRNELGGMTTFTYENSRKFDQAPVAYSTETPPIPSTIALRGARWVPASVVHSDGRTSTAQESTSNELTALRYDASLRQDVGFRMTRETDATGVTTRTHFHQGPERSGKSEVVETINGSSVLKSVATQWTLAATQNAAGTPIAGSWLARPYKTTTTFSIGAASQVSILERAFDARTGQLLEEVDFGPDSIKGTSDDRRQVVAYSPNFTSWLVSYQIRQEEYFGSTCAGTRYATFDELAFGAPPTKGRLTREDLDFDGCGASPPSAESLEVSKLYTYDLTYGTLNEYFDPNYIKGAQAGFRQDFDFDASYHTFVSRITNRLGHIQMFAFDAGLGEVVQMLDENGYVRCWDYDDFGRLVSIQDSTADTLPASFPASCNTTLASFAFNAVGVPDSQNISETRFGSSTLITKRYFDGWGREYETLAQASGADFFSSRKGWGTRGEEVCASLPKKVTGAVGGLCTATHPYRTSTYDGLGRVLTTSLVSSASNSALEAANSFSISDLDGLSGNELVQQSTVYTGAASGVSPDRVRRTGTDSRGQVVAVQELGFGGGTTYLRRDPRGRITEVDGPDIQYSDSGWNDPNVLEITYDYLDRRTTVVPQGNFSVPLLSTPVCNNPNAPGSRSPWTFVYDANGNLISKISPKGTEIRFSYDGLDRTTRKDFAPFGVSANDTTFTYDAAASNATGRLRFVDTPVVDTTIAYRLQGEVASKTRTYPIGSLNIPFIFGYGYDNLGRLLAKTFPDKTRATFDYDGALPVGVNTAEPTGSFTPLVDQVTFHDGGEIGTIRFRTTVATQVLGTYAFDFATHRPSLSTTTGPTGTLQSISFSFDRAGNLLTANDAQGINQSFSYDEMHRLKQATATGPASLSYGTIPYSYDASGNVRGIGADILKYECSPGGPTAVTRLTSSSGTTKRSYTYNRDGDATGLTESGWVHTLTRDDDGQLSAFTTGSQVSSYSYDESGQRSAKSHANSTGAAIIDRLYVDKDYDVDLTSAFHERHFFVSGRRVATIRRDGLGWNLDGGTPASETKRFYHPDQVGTNAVTTEGAGTVVQRTTHTPFGVRHAMLSAAGGTVPDSATTARNQFTGHEYDPESQLTYMGARYYDPNVGRFLERDPALIESKVGATFSKLPIEPGGLSSYSYVLNNPTTFRDPDGTRCTGASGNYICLFDYIVVNGVKVDRSDWAKNADPKELKAVQRFEANLSKAITQLSKTPGKAATIQVTRIDARGDPVPVIKSRTGGPLMSGDKQINQKGTFTVTAAEIVGESEKRDLVAEPSNFTREKLGSSNGGPVTITRAGLGLVDNIPRTDLSMQMTGVHEYIHGSLSEWRAFPTPNDPSLLGPGDQGLHHQGPYRDGVTELLRE